MDFVKNQADPIIHPSLALEAMSTQQQNNWVIQAAATPGSSQSAVASNSFKACYKISPTVCVCVFVLQIKVNVFYKELKKKRFCSKWKLQRE